MRKTTVIAIGIMLFGLVAVVVLFQQYTKNIVPDIQKAKVLTKEFKGRLEANTTIKLRRVPSGEGYLVGDKKSPGVLVEAQPSADAWSKDKNARGIASDIGQRLFEIYDAELPIEWVQFRMKKPDGERIPEFAARSGDGGVGVSFLEGGK